MRRSLRPLIEPRASNGPAIRASSGGGVVCSRLASAVAPKPTRRAFDVEAIEIGERRAALDLSAQQRRAQVRHLDLLRIGGEVGDDSHVIEMQIGIAIGQVDPVQFALDQEIIGVVEAEVARRIDGAALRGSPCENASGFSARRHGRCTCP